MKNVKVKIIVSDPRAKAKVGDVVEFQVGDEFIQDTITYIGNNCIEGEKFSLTTVNFKIIKK